MTVTFEQFLNRCALDTEDPEKFQQYVPKLEAYREKLNKAIKPELTCTLPAPIETLRDQQFNAVDFIKTCLTAEELRITNSTASELLASYSSGTLTVTEVYKCFAKRATMAHQLTNCALELFTDEGLERAAFLDDYFKKNGELFGPLHGVPISLKEHLDYEGKTTHACYVALIDTVSEKDCMSVGLIRGLGAVFYIRTNQPQSLMHACSDNNFVGFTYCPYNISLTSGGSSSGEGALVASGGSVIGIGSDIAGSIRIPAAFSGCYGLRPTTKRISVLGCTGGDPGQESIVPVSGPLTRTVEDINLFMEAYANAGKPWEKDPDMLRMEWRKVEKPVAKDLKIGILYDDGIVRPTPPITRGLNTVAAKLEAAGVTVVDFEPIKTELLYNTALNVFSADGGVACKGALRHSGEPMRKLTKWFLNLGTGDQAVSVQTNRDYVGIRNQMREEYTKFMNDNEIDFLISPVVQNVAEKPGTNCYFGYTVIENVLDFPSLTFPTGLYQDPALDKWENPEELVYRSPLEELSIGDYKPEDYKNAPIAAKIAGRRYFDEEVVAAAKLISEILEVDLLK